MEPEAHRGVAMKLLRMLGGLTVAGTLLVLSAGSVARLAAQAPTVSQGQGEVTFTKDVAPILQRSCQDCHRPGSIGPMPLITYEDVRPWARRIHQRVAAREMPPWLIEQNVGIQEFKDDISLSDAEIATITAWVDGGVLRGDPSDLPPPRTFDDDDDWRIGTPDLVVRVPQDWTVPAEGADAWIESIAPTGLTEDRYIKAIQTRTAPGTLGVIHHVTTTMSIPDGPWQSLSEYSVGKNADIMPEGAGILLEAGSSIKFQVHYSSLYGEEVVDTLGPELGFVFYPKGVVPEKVVVRRSVGSPVHGDINGIDVPAGADNVRIEGFTRLNNPTRIVSFQPHMHARGRRMCMEAILPSTEVETLSCTRYDVNWNIVYVYDDDVAPLLPEGTLLRIVGWHDNSAANPLNPDPRNWVGWGARTIDDMNFAHVGMVDLDQAEFERQVAEREAQQRTPVSE
jgi:hypothetical protein